MGVRVVSVSMASCVAPEKGVPQTQYTYFGTCALRVLEAVVGNFKGLQ